MKAPSIFWFAALGISSGRNVNTKKLFKKVKIMDIDTRGENIYKILSPIGIPEIFTKNTT